MAYKDKVLKEILKQTKVSPEALKEAKYRRDLILELVLKTYDGASQSVKSGSIAHKTTSFKLDDADGSIVLDRRTHHLYGPDGGGKGPQEIVEDVRQFLDPLVRQVYPDVMISTGHKRAIYFRFRAPLDDVHETDPTVDIVIGLTRKDKPGLWIPNMKRGIWQPSDPARHTELMLDIHKRSGGDSTKVVRLVKMYCKQWQDPELLTSFHVSALMLETYDLERSVADNLLALFQHAERVLAKYNTADPAGVSEHIKISSKRDREVLVKKLSRIVSALEKINELEKEGADEARIDDELSRIYWNKKMGGVLDDAAKTTKRVAINSAIISGAETVMSSSISPRPVVNARAYGSSSVVDNPTVRKIVKEGMQQTSLGGLFEAGIESSGYSVLWKSTSLGPTIYTVSMVIPTYGTIMTKIVIEGQNASVYAYGVIKLRHTYRDGSLCLYYPGDPVESRWVFKRGLVSLLDLVKLHLYKECEHKRTGEDWLGEEIHA